MYGMSLGDDGAELGPLEPWQADEYFTHIERGRDYIGRFVGLPDAAKDCDAARAWLQSYADKAARDAGRLWGIRVDGRLVGGVLFRTFDAAQGVAEAGCWLEPSAAGRGLVTRAATAIIDWAVLERGIHRVEWIAGSANTASINVAKRLGMTRDGVLRQSFLYRGERQDMEVWSVLAPEWRTAREGHKGR
ncbi:GNAT family N-acetyltransferase [Streptomyces beihaiensis]|uniref:GNAT family N-acetyltransferase n=1 Tax=Streptomyces beihaiensis TaxID=2984495 RepID=A0ABT3U034_9ACTN|nr:GNAT family protein [Streptomyces beihaiensis]MCX3062673.1 GNAT family N-acetyltransferase [Streptomyces beihaiensis]